MANEKFFRILDDLASTKSFSAVSRITEAGEIKQKKLEFVMRFFAFTSFDFDTRYDVEEFIDKHIVELSQDERGYLRIKDEFVKTFDLLFKAAGKDALRRYDPKTRKFVGKVGQVALESVAVGIARNLSAIMKLSKPADFVLSKVKAFWREEEVKKFSASGVSGTKRLSETVEYGAKYFEP